MPFVRVLPSVRPPTAHREEHVLRPGPLDHLENARWVRDLVHGDPDTEECLGIAPARLVVATDVAATLRAVSAAAGAVVCFLFLRVRRWRRDASGGAPLRDVDFARDDRDLTARA